MLLLDPRGILHLKLPPSIVGTIPFQMADIDRTRSHLPDRGGTERLKCGWDDRQISFNMLFFFINKRTNCLVSAANSSVERNQACCHWTLVCLEPRQTMEAPLTPILVPLVGGVAGPQSCPTVKPELPQLRNLVLSELNLIASRAMSQAIRWHRYLLMASDDI